MSIVKIAILRVQHSRRTSIVPTWDYRGARQKPRIASSDCVPHSPQNSRVPHSGRSFRLNHFGALSVFEASLGIPHDHVRAPAVRVMTTRASTGFEHGFASSEAHRFAITNRFEFIALSV